MFSVVSGDSLMQGEYGRCACTCKCMCTCGHVCACACVSRVTRKKNVFQVAPIPLITEMKFNLLGSFCACFKAIAT